MNELEEKNFFNSKETYYAYFKCIKTKNAQKFISNRKLEKIDIDLWDFNRFKYLEYFLNRNKLKKIINNLKYDQIILYGYWSACFQNPNFKKSILIIRSSQGIGKSLNFYSGYKKILYYINS